MSRHRRDKRESLVNLSAADQKIAMDVSKRYINGEDLGPLAIKYGKKKWEIRRFIAAVYAVNPNGPKFNEIKKIHNRNR